MPVFPDVGWKDPLARRNRALRLGAFRASTWRRQNADGARGAVETQRSLANNRTPGLGLRLLQLTSGVLPIAPITSGQHFHGSLSAAGLRARARRIAAPGHRQAVVWDQGAEEQAAGLRSRLNEHLGPGRPGSAPRGRVCKTHGGAARQGRGVDRWLLLRLVVEPLDPIGDEAPVSAPEGRTVGPREVRVAGRVRQALKATARTATAELVLVAPRQLARIREHVSVPKGLSASRA